MVLTLRMGCGRANGLNVRREQAGLGHVDERLEELLWTGAGESEGTPKDLPGETRRVVLSRYPHSDP